MFQELRPYSQNPSYRQKLTPESSRAGAGAEERTIKPSESTTRSKLQTALQTARAPGHERKKIRYAWKCAKKSRCGRPHKLSDRAIVRKVKKNPKISAPKLADQLATASGKKVHLETVRRILRSGGYNGRVSSRKPFISVNQQKRLDFASPHVDKDFDFWNTAVCV
ncbi:hypothetical protein TNIN_308861 [Trichonephila inaurata madagascariensis]|uniref:Transposase Tc1-like domain-containing protein n=1 Tax=Trichonephila inaurata madagascariensis TaxID=2747483 RepID=A0A8X7BRP0_9ARAC|nr:hypothetical protein TNIN_308861 [Trichonephila inaurata madagascariensis]